MKKRIEGSTTAPKNLKTYNKGRLAAGLECIRVRDCVCARNSFQERHCRILSFTRSRDGSLTEPRPSRPLSPRPLSPPTLPPSPRVVAPPQSALFAARRREAALQLLEFGLKTFRNSIVERQVYFLSGICCHGALGAEGSLAEGTSAFCNRKFRILSGLFFAQAKQKYATALVKPAGS